MRKVLLALLLASSITLSMSASAGTLVDVGVPTGSGTININDGVETPLWNVINNILVSYGWAGVLFTSNDDLDAGIVPGFSIVDVDDYSSNGGAMFDLERSYTVDARIAGGHHSLTAASRANASSMVLFPLNSVGTGDGSLPVPPLAGPVTVTGVTSPFDLVLGVDRRPFGGTEDYSLSSNYLNAMNDPSTQTDDVQMLLFNVSSMGLGFDYIYAWEDLLAGDFDYNDFVGTISVIVPLPPALGLMLLGMGGVGALRLRRKAVKS